MLLALHTQRWQRPDLCRPLGKYLPNVSVSWALGGPGGQRPESGPGVSPCFPGETNQTSGPTGPLGAPTERPSPGSLGRVAEASVPVPAEGSPRGADRLFRALAAACCHRSAPSTHPALAHGDNLPSSRSPVGRWRGDASAGPQAVSAGSSGRGQWRVGLWDCPAVLSWHRGPRGSEWVLARAPRAGAHVWCTLTLPGSSAPW